MALSEKARVQRLGHLLEDASLFGGPIATRLVSFRSIIGTSQPGKDFTVDLGWLLNTDPVGERFARVYQGYGAAIRVRPRGRTGWRGLEIQHVGDSPGVRDWFDPRTRTR